MRYHVTGRAVAIHSGVLELTPEQANTRLHNLQLISEGRYQVVHSVEFKFGEKFGYDGSFPKVLADDVQAEAVQAEAVQADVAKSKSKAKG